jgi:hypothetical protein
MVYKIGIRNSDHWMQILMSTLSQKKLSQLKDTLYSPSLYLSIEGFHLDRSTGAVFYDIEIGIALQNDRFVHISNTRLRYSDLDRLDREIRRCLDSPNYLPAFPPKRFIGNTNQDFLKRRASDLQDYLDRLSRLCLVVCSAPFRSTFLVGANRDG